jgi:nucleoside-diphosphate-sugar epimerase
MRVLITGANGFVGRHVVSALQDDHVLYTPTRSELDLLKPGNLVDYLGTLNTTDAIVHLAATCGGIGINKDNPGKFIYENLQMGINVLEAARLADVPKVVNLGSVCSYPKFVATPFHEDHLWMGYPEETNAPYGIAKKAVMEMGMAYSRQYDLNVTNFLPANMYGEWDNFDLYSSHVIPAIIRKFEEPQLAITSDTPPKGSVGPAMSRYVKLWGDGSASREFLYAGDCARAIAVALERDTSPEPINLGTGREITIADLATLIKQVGDYSADIYWDESQPNGQPKRSLDIRRAQERLRWEPNMKLEEGLRRVINWYRNQKQQ